MILAKGFEHFEHSQPCRRKPCCIDYRAAVSIEKPAYTELFPRLPQLQLLQLQYCTFFGQIDVFLGPVIFLLNAKYHLHVIYKYLETSIKFIFILQNNACLFL